MIVFENGEKLRGSARKRIIFENAEKLRSARRVIANNRRFAKLWDIAEQKNGVFKNIGKARTIRSLAE